MKHDAIHLRVDLKRDIKFKTKIRRGDLYFMRSACGTWSWHVFREPTYFSVCGLRQPRCLETDLNEVTCSRCLEFIHRYLRKPKTLRSRLPFRNYRRESENKE